MDKTQQAYDYLKKEIVTGRLRPETPIVELDVSAALKMSRSPVREAIRALEKEGLVVSYAARGTCVAALSPFDVEEIYELRILMECWALESSLDRISQQELNQADEAFTAAYEAKDWEKLHQADRFLHSLIVDKALCRRLNIFISILNSQVERIRYASERNSRRAEQSYREHRAIVEGLRSGDLERCKALLRDHLHSVARSALEVIKYEQSQL